MRHSIQLHPTLCHETKRSSCRFTYHEVAKSSCRSIALYVFISSLPCIPPLRFNSVQLQSPCSSFHSTNVCDDFDSYRSEPIQMGMWHISELEFSCNKPLRQAETQIKFPLFSNSQNHRGKKKHHEIKVQHDHSLLSPNRCSWKKVSAIDVILI